MRSSRRTVALVAALALSVAACGGDDGGDSADSADNGEGTAGEGTAGDEGDGGDGEVSGELSVWIMQPGSDEVETIIEDAASAFEDEHEGTTIDVQFVPWANAHDQFVTAIGGGQVPDVAEMGTTWTPEFAELGALAELEDPGEGYVESLIDSGSFEGTAYGYPWYAGARSLIYRQDVFDELDLEAPETWDDVLEAGEVIADETDMDPINVAGDYVHMLAPMVWQFGGDIATEQDGAFTASVDSEAGIAAFETYAGMFERGWSPEGAVGWNSVDVRDAFANGDSAMMLGGGWDLAAATGANEELEGQVATTLSPAGGEGGSNDAFAGGSHLTVFEASENKELATEYIEFMLEPEQVTEFTETIGFLPGTVEGVEASSAAGDEVFGTFAAQLTDHSRSYPASPAWGAIEGNNVVTNAIQEVMTGGLSVEEAVAQVDEQMDAEFSG